ncbi:hypothetical protein [Bradyrhizobium sp. SSUT77]|uniref:hypothetical protein n=1 Tax=Bradyrhizobium sp. SSUT77 TaxID=3040603 RepID=UPI00244994C7|nr:hypothetical protein [Bradyrhizobium sp. SSUT77]MDH2343073.1 hypothetical protein [Bradyrhizobium sp. SSUT77]
MNTIILIIERDSPWSPEMWASDHEGKRGIDNQLVIERKEEWLSIVRDDRVLDDFDEAERSRLNNLVIAPVTYLLEWRGHLLVESLLRSVPANLRAAIDNDHGLLLPLQELASKPINDWARASTLKSADGV